MKHWLAVGVIGTLLALGGAEGCSSSGSSSSACGQYFTEVLARCEYAGYPASEITRIQPRFVAACEAIITLPGSSLGGLASCAQAVAGLSCNTRISEPSGCAGLTMGTLAAGATCLSGNQCQSGACTITNAAPTGDGGVNASVCGTCDTSIADGQPCGMMGASCLPQSNCDPTTMKCAAPPAISGNGGVGATCMTDADCQAALSCSFSMTGGASTCKAPSAAGGPCPCDAGLTCTSNNTCAAQTYVSAGQPCSDLAGGARCLEGTCPFNGMTAICPTVIADGQPCDSNSQQQTCDAFAECIAGTCQIPGAALCK